jgi:hypothetical protein
MASTDVQTRDGALVVELTKAAFEALERETRAQMDTAIGELGMGEYELTTREKLNACADVLSAVGRAKSAWSLEDPREEASLKATKLSAAAVAFLCEQREATAGYIAEQDVHGEADYKLMGRECFLLHVLDRVLTEGVAA